MQSVCVIHPDAIPVMNLLRGTMRRCIFFVLVLAGWNVAPVSLQAAAYTVSNFAGASGYTGPDDGTGAAARFSSPNAIAVQSNGNVYVADSGNNTIRLISSTGVVSTFAGLAGVFGSADGSGVAASFYAPKGLAIDASGTLYVGDTYNHVIRKITAAGVVSTLAGTPGSIGSSDGSGAAARFNYPLGVAVDSGGNVYVADSLNHTIRKITAGGVPRCRSA